MDVWKGVNPNEAEAQLRGLNRRLDELDAAMDDQQAALKERPESFAFQLAGKSLLVMHNRLRAEKAALLKHRVAERLDLALDGGAFQNHSASLGALGALLIRLQKLYSSIGQALLQGPTLRGPLAGDIISATELRLAATYPSSFGMSLVVSRKQDLLEDALPSASLSTMFSVFSAVGGDDGLMKFSGELGGRSINHLRHIAAVVARSNSSVQMEWSDSSGIKHYWQADPEEMRAAVTRLSSIKETRSTAMVCVGRIVGASLLRNRFELKLEDGQVIEGALTAPAATAITDLFGKICEAGVDETEVADGATGVHKTYYTLTSLKAVTSGPATALPQIAP